MCDKCGCEQEHEGNHEHHDVVGSKIIDVNKSVTEANDELAQQIGNFLKDKGILSINLMGAPGSGKTTFIEQLVEFIPAEEIAVIQGDLESDIDKKRLEKKNIHTFQINTHSGCHLNAMMVNKALMHMQPSGKKYLIIENVGNLVCPAAVQIGQHIDIVVSSTTEGTDKPKKYPVIFMNTKMIVLSKYDLKEAVGFEETKYLEDLKNINAEAKIVKVSSKDPESFKDAAEFIRDERERLFKV
ncbi:hydrogenase nickel incorporation protein HypB [Candidatus Woesearchaeota archaeon]|jgi:hydrogenase nickel incorporation protein HypB|nr:hydrogenase nickel incorporation protein HypB [Candidatus Woesearchaeota archaeon]MBT5272794.1 hydrogenase nickel incorporation protein HypB [Candidatus Woesearchaeota archaeon]MBT6040406.1 hydrogenase nickel incorporation protein HypB [Candidatus Woesearchaeota archaeon]MBT6336961.1 hydrogenase nickel incorporation protein HypB [Candidatus Woesearchaeota archaeon]MBT7926847.1 hydrogenase nickel incorporation protein HypB [Candidatus Woesearchaeota archaeon]